VPAAPAPAPYFPPEPTRYPAPPPYDDTPFEPPLHAAAPPPVMQQQQRPQARVGAGGGGRPHLGWGRGMGRGR
jgi:hypothetical protein